MHILNKNNDHLSQVPSLHDKFRNALEQSVVLKLVHMAIYKKKKHIGLIKKSRVHIMVLFFSHYHCSFFISLSDY